MVSPLVTRVRRRRNVPSSVEARAILEAAGVSQRELAAELGVHRVTVSRWVGGQQRPRGDVALEYADLLEQLRKVAT